MYGHGVAPPTRSAATVITLRVLFAAAGILTCGVFACVPLFRVALLRGQWFHWTAAWLSLPVCIACFMVIGVLPESDVRTDIALALVLLIGAASSAWFLTVDIRFHNEQRHGFRNGQRPGAGYLPSGAPTVHSPYGYPQAASPYAQTPVPQPPAGPASVPQAASPYAQTPVPPPSGPPSGPARIDQVRAELDELSDYLRRQDGNQQDGR